MDPDKKFQLPPETVVMTMEEEDDDEWIDVVTVDPDDDTAATLTQNQSMDGVEEGGPADMATASSIDYSFSDQEEQGVVTATAEPKSDTSSLESNPHQIPEELWTEDETTSICESACSNPQEESMENKEERMSFKTKEFASSVKSPTPSILKNYNMEDVEEGENDDASKVTTNPKLNHCSIHEESVEKKGITGEAERTVSSEATTPQDQKNKSIEDLQEGVKDDSNKGASESSPAEQKEDSMEKGETEADHKSNKGTVTGIAESTPTVYMEILDCEEEGGTNIESQGSTSSLGLEKSTGDKGGKDESKGTANIERTLQDEPVLNSVPPGPPLTLPIEFVTSQLELMMLDHAPVTTEAAAAATVPHVAKKSSPQEPLMECVSSGVTIKFYSNVTFSRDSDGSVTATAPPTHQTHLPLVGCSRNGVTVKLFSNVKFAWNWEGALTILPRTEEGSLLLAPHQVVSLGSSIAAPSLNTVTLNALTQSELAAMFNARGRGRGRPPGIGRGRGRPPGIGQGRGRSPGIGQGRGRPPGIGRGRGRPPGIGRGRGPFLQSEKPAGLSFTTSTPVHNMRGRGRGTTRRGRPPLNRLNPTRVCGGISMIPLPIPVEAPVMVEPPDKQKASAAAKALQEAPMPSTSKTAKPQKLRQARSEKPSTSTPAEPSCSEVEVDTGDDGSGEETERVEQPKTTKQQAGSKNKKSRLMAACNTKKKKATKTKKKEKKLVVKYPSVPAAPASAAVTADGPTEGEEGEDGSAPKKIKPTKKQPPRTSTRKRRRFTKIESPPKDLSTSSDIE